MGNLVRGKSAEDGQSEMQSMQKKFVKKSHNFPFLVDSRTIRHVEGSKVMFIMRGLSGSGKSTIVRLLQEVFVNLFHILNDFSLSVWQDN